MRLLILFISFLISQVADSQIINASPPYRVKASAVDYFNPNDVSGCLMWVYADTLGLANDDPVSTWTDLSGNGNDATQTSTARPLYKTNIQNGRAALLFDGSNDFMDIANTSIVGGNTGMTVFVVVKQATLAINNTILCKWDYNTQGTFAVQTEDGSTDEVMMYLADVCNDDGSDHQDATNANLTTQFYVLTFVYDGSQGASADRVKIYRDGTLLTAATSGTLPTSLTSCTATLKIGSFGGSLSRKYSGYMGEIVLYNAALGTTDRQNVENYLKAHWGL